MKKNKKIWFTLVFLGSSLALTIVALATGTIHWPDRGMKAQIKGNLPVQASKYIYHPLPFYYPFREGATNMWGIYPFTQDFSTLGRHNSHGFRTPEYTIAHPPNTFRIVVVGDGVTYAPGVLQEQTYAYILAKLLNQGCSAFHTEVVALGVPGQRITDKWIELLAHGQSLKPDLLIFQIGPNDLNKYAYRNIFSIQRVPDFTRAFQEKELEVFSETSSDWKIFSQSLDEIKRWHSTSSVPVVFLAFPLIDTFRSGHNFDHYDVNAYPQLPQLSQFPKVVNYIRSLGFPVLDMKERFREKSIDQYLAISEYQESPNPFAHRFISENLFSFLTEQQLFDCSTVKLRRADAQWNAEALLRNNANENWLAFTISYSKQQALFENLIKLYPRDPWIANELADLFFAEERWREANRTYLSLVQLAPSISAPWFHMGITGATTRARIHDLEKMLQIIPGHALALQSISGLYVREERIPEACQVLSRLIQVPINRQQYEKAQTQLKENNCASVLAKTAKTTEKESEEK